MPLKSDYATQECSIARALEVIGERWTLLIVRDLFFGVRTFTDLQRHLGVPRAVLSTRLDTLRAAGVAERSEYQPGRHEYGLTERGETLWPTVFALHHWGDENFAPQGPRAIFVHAACGTELTGHATCPHCRHTPAPRDIDMLPGPARAADTATDPVSLALHHRHRLLDPLPPR